MSMSPSRDTGAVSPPPEDSDTLLSDPPDGPLREEFSILASEQIHSPATDDEEDEDHAREVLLWRRLSWWKRPSPYWLIFGAPLHSIGFSAILAPKVDMYTILACRVHRPEYIPNDHSLHSFAFPPSHTLAPIHPPDAPVSQVPPRSEPPVDTLDILLPNSTYPPPFHYTQSGPDFKQMCSSDPVVQAAAARLNAVFTTSMGILSCLTTGWWGSLSDRYGRRIVVLVSAFGLLVTDVTHIITAFFVDVLPGGYWFLLVCYWIDGLCGSASTGIAVNHAYLADTTDPSTRSRYFSLSLGLTFTGVAVGPVLGGILIRLTGSTLSVFYLATALHALSAILILTVLPESLTQARARGARLRWRKEKANQVYRGRASNILKHATRFLSPLVVLLPERSLDANPLKRSRRDWNLFFIAISYGFVISILGSFPYKFQYAAAQFKWTPEITSYYISSVGAVRAVFLAVLLPLIIKYFNPAPVQLPSMPDEPLRGAIGLSPTPDPSSRPGSPQPNASEQRSPSPRSPAFDLALARVSAGLEVAAFLGMAVARSGGLFTFVSMIGSFSVGFSPAAHALALEIYTKRSHQGRGEIGKLFGALSVIQALGSQIISPALYGFVYFNTVAFFPQAILVVSMCASLLALTFLSFVRIPSKPAGDAFTPGIGNLVRSEGLEAPEILVAMEDEVVAG